MKKSLFNVLASIGLVTSFVSCSLASENSYAVNFQTETRATSNMSLPPSQLPPAGLEPANVPQFVIMSFDDNQYPDGMRNMLNVYSTITNPAGTGNAATFDGTPGKTTFFVTPGGRDATGEWTVSDDTVLSWKEASMQGHEIGNHTYYHEHGSGFTVERWTSELIKTNDFLTTRLGLQASEIRGFRTPFLEYNQNLFTALKNQGFEYDSSYEDGWRYWPHVEDGSTLYWPFTLDHDGPPGDGRALGKVAGVWELPIPCIFYEDNGTTARVTGFDYNIWFAKSATKQMFLDMLKHALQKSYYGNRSPFNFGTHTNYYSDMGFEDLKIWDPNSVSKLTTTVAERTAAIKEFLDYAVTLSDVRVVSLEQVLDWMKNPAPLKPMQMEFAVSAAGDANGTVTASAAVVPRGGAVTFTLSPAAGYVVDKAYLNNVEVAVTGNSYTVNDVTEDLVFNASFILESQKVNDVVAAYTVSQDWGTGFGADVVISNNGQNAISSWTVKIVYSGNQKVSGWNAQVSQSGQVVTATNLSWNGTIPAGGSTSFGLNGSYSGTNDAPVVTVE